MEWGLPRARSSSGSLHHRATSELELSGSSKTLVAEFMAERRIYQEEWEWARPMIIEELKGRSDGI
jgi:hypothetical protein